MFTHHTWLLLPCFPVISTGTETHRRTLNPIHADAAIFVRPTPPSPPGQRVVGRHVQLVAEQQGKPGRPGGPRVAAEEAAGHEHAR